MFNEFEYPVLLNALKEYRKIAVNVPSEQIDRIEAKLVNFMDGTSIADIWSIEDVFSLMFPEDDLDRGHTDAEIQTAKDVLASAMHNHNAEYGINWDSLQAELDAIVV